MGCHGIRITILNLIYVYIYNLYWVHCHHCRCRPLGQTMFIHLLVLLSLSLSLNVVSEPQSLFLINLHCHFFRCIRAHTQDIMGISSIPRLLIYGFRSSQNHCFSITHTLAHHLSPNHALPALNTPSTSHMCLEPSHAIFFPRMLLI